VGSYDDVFWGWAYHQQCPQSVAAIAGQPSFAGGFAWTGFAYRGEPSPYGWPSTSSHFGAMDLCGSPRPSFYVSSSPLGEEQAGADPRAALELEGKGRSADPRPGADQCWTGSRCFSTAWTIEEKPVNGFDMVEMAGAV
jgi:hypothetical protein